MHYKNYFYLKIPEMSEEECPFKASDDQIILQTSWILRLNIIYCTFLSIGCFVGVAYCIRFMRKHPIFSESTAILLYLSLAFAVFHDVAHVLSQVSSSSDPINKKKKVSVGSDV